MDIKNSYEKYPETSGAPGLDLAPVTESVRLLLRGAVPYEFRTTLVKPLHTAADIEKIGRAVAGAEIIFFKISKTAAILSVSAACPPMCRSAASLPGKPNISGIFCHST